MANSSADWLQVASFIGIPCHNLAIEYSASRNLDSLTRSTFICVTATGDLSQKVQVVQAGSIPLSVNRITFPAGIDAETGKLPESPFVLIAAVPWRIKVGDSEEVPSWLQVSKASGEAGVFTISVQIKELNYAGVERTAPINVVIGENNYTIEVRQETSTERAALVAFYQATGGDHWKDNTNWCSDKPFGEWYGVTEESGSVVRINIFNNNLEGPIPDEIALLPNMQLLALGYNKLSGGIPVSLGNVTNLTFLDLGGNELSGSIPEVLSNLSNLQYLCLEKNQLTGSIPESLGNLANLQYLYLYTNQLTGSIPESLGNLTNMRSLNLRNNQLTGSIPESLGNLTNLHNLYVDSNQLTGSIPESIANLDDLTNFSCRYNYLDVSDLAAFVNHSSYSRWRLTPQYAL